MSHRPDPDTEPGDPARTEAVPDAARRTLLRGVAVFGLAGVTGTLAACGGGGEAAVTSAAGPPADPIAEAPAKLPATKSEVYKRRPSPASSRKPPPTRWARSPTWPARRSAART